MADYTIRVDLPLRNEVRDIEVENADTVHEAVFRAGLHARGFAVHESDVILVSISEMVKAPKDVWTNPNA